MKITIVIGAWAYACCCALSPGVNSAGLAQALAVALLVSVVCASKW